MNHWTTSQVNLASLSRIAQLLGPPPEPFAIWTHPANLELLERAAPASPAWVGLPDLLGVPIYTSRHLPRWHRRWEFPPTPFVEYEKSDERWAIPLGLGRWVDDTTRPAFFKIPERRPAAWVWKGTTP